MPRPKTVLAMRPALRPLLFDAAAEARLAALAETDPELVVEDFADPRVTDALKTAEVLITGWDCPVLDAAALEKMPDPTTVLHSGGSVKHYVTPAFWERGLAISSAVADNAIPVAEYTLAIIIGANKRLAELERAFRAGRDGRDWQHWSEAFPGIGNHRRTVGVVGFSRVGRRVVEMLRSGTWVPSEASPNAAAGFKFDSIQLPAVDGGNTDTGINFFGFAVPKTASHADAAEKFIAFFMKKDELSGISTQALNADITAPDQLASIGKALSGSVYADQGHLSVDYPDWSNMVFAPEIIRLETGQDDAAKFVSTAKQGTVDYWKTQP